MTPGRGSRLANAWLKLVSRAFPVDARDRIEGGLAETFADRWVEERGHGRLRALRFLVHATADVLAAGWLERLGRVLDGGPRERKGGTGMRGIGGDIRFAVRGLRRSPFFTAVAVATLAVGIGATTTMFSVLEAVLLRPWPFPAASELVIPVTTRPSTGESWSVNYADYEDWQAAGVFEGVAVFQRPTADLSAPGGDPERVRGIVATAEFLDVLGVRPLLGRFPRSDEHAGGGRVVVLAHGFWQGRFGGDAGIVGEAIRLNGEPYVVIGVLPPGADVLDVAMVTPLRTDPDRLESFRDRDNFAFAAIARLRPGQDMEAARTELAAVAARIEREHGALREGTSADIVPLARWLAGDELSVLLWVALASVGLVLLIGCANVANLLLARGLRREQELAVRGALGANRGRLVTQLLVESGVLGLMGAAAGVVLASIGIRVIAARVPDDVARLDTLGLNPTVLLFALLLSLGSVAVFGLLPAFRSTARAGARVLSERGGEGRSAGRRWRSGLVIAEVALTIVLLAGAGLMLRSLTRVLSVDPGFDTSNVLAFSILLPASRYPDAGTSLAAHERLRERLGAVPGIVAVAQASQLPLGASSGYLNRAYLPEGGAEPPAGPEVIGPWEIVTPGYFATMGHAVRQGREFNDGDDANSTPVMIVNRELVRRMFGADTDAIGRRVRSWRDENVYRTIVGVVDDVRYFGAGDEIRPVAYIPLRQDPRRGLNYVVRAAADPRALVPGIRAAVREFDPDLATAAFTTMDEAFHGSVASRRLAVSLLSGFALIALLLAGIGLYGVLAISVTERTREFGVRMALGAGAGSVRSMVLRDAARLIGLGVLAGLFGAFAVTRVLSRVLFDTSATDPVTFAAAIAVLCAVGLLASWWPAVRATRVDPMGAIRAG